MSNTHQKKKKRSNTTSKKHKKQQQPPIGPKLFSAFAKFSNDLLIKGYNYDQTLSITSHTGNGGVAVTSRATRHRRRWTANIGARYDHENAGFEVNFDTKSSISTTFTFGVELLPSTFINAALKFPEYGLSKLNLNFQQYYRNAALSISVDLNQSPDIMLSTTIGTSSIAFGMESKYKTASRSFTRYDAGISVTNPSSDASIILHEKGDLLRLAYAHHFGQPRKVSAIAEVTRRLSKKENSLTVGVSCIVDNLTTAKATLNNRGKLQAALLHKIRRKSSLNISSEFDVKALDKIPKIGLALVLVL